MALINTTTTGVLGTTVFGDGSGDLTIQQNGVLVNKITSNGLTYRGTGSVLQVVSTNKNDTFSTTSTSFTDVTGLSVSITPSSTTSKILVFVDTNYSPSGTSTLAAFNLVRGATNISQPATAPTYTGSFVAYTNAADTMLTPSFNFLDSPATTSATTYKIQVKTNSGTVYLNRRLSTDTASTSTITVMEIAV